MKNQSFECFSFSNERKETQALKLNFSLRFCFLFFDGIFLLEALFFNYVLLVWSCFWFGLGRSRLFWFVTTYSGSFYLYKPRLYRKYQFANLLKMNFMFDFITADHAYYDGSSRNVLNSRASVFTKWGSTFALQNGACRIIK